MKTLRYVGVSALIFLLLTACQPVKKEYRKISGFAQGTDYHITYETDKGKDYSEDIAEILKKFDKSLSIYDSTSIISRINRNEPNVKIDNWFERVYNKSLEINQLSGGAFDITVGPVVRAWGFTTAPVARYDSAYIDSLRQFVGMEKIKLENGTIVKSMTGTMIDVNAIAQGFSVDVVCDFLEDEGVDNYLVEIGGEVRGKGVNAKGNFWRIGIDKPADGNMVAGQELEAIVEIQNKSIATSGNYRKFFVENGVKYSHTINPKTGRPAMNKLLSATVVADDCMTADALATSFMVLGTDKAKELLTKLPGIEVLFISDGSNGKYELYYTKGMKKMIMELAQ
jgi:thiamine biosynthesis lipoprotein